MAGPDYTDTFSKLQSPSLLQQTHDALAIRQQMQTVQGNQMQLQAREAMGPILQGAIDQKTGELDYNKAFVGMAANPATAWMAPEFLDKAVARQGTQAETALKELQKHREQATAIYDSLGGLLPRGSALTRQEVIGAFSGLYGEGRIDKEHLLNAVAQLPQDGAPLYNYAKQVALRAQGAAKSLEMTHKDITSRDVGGAEVFVQPKPLEGTVEQVGVLPKTLTPEKREELIDTIDPATGKTMKAPRSQLFPSGASPAPTGQQGAGASQPSGTPPQSGVVTKLAPQVEKAWEKMGEKYTSIIELGQVNQGVEYALDTAENLLKRYTPNAAAEVREKVAAGLNALGIDQEIVNKVGSGSLPAGEVFKSVMLDLATNRMKKALEGGGRFTNIEFQTFNETKPNPKMSAQAVRELIQYYRRGVQLDKMYIRGYNHFLQNGRSPTDFENWWQDRLDDLQKRRRGSND